MTGPDDGAYDGGERPTVAAKVAYGLLVELVLLLWDLAP